MRFAKYHGLGNDFVLVDARGSGELIRADQARTICDRHRGVGADGVLTLLPSRTAEASVRMHLHNADGSVAEMCGNGLRCAVRAVLEGTGQGHVVFDTDAGLREGWMLGPARVRVSLGAPRAAAEARELVVGAERVRGLEVSMGNPHFVLDARPGGADLRAEAARLGPAIERHPAFPNRTNVELIAREGDVLRVVVFERGVGITEACGTGAAAAAYAARRAGLFSGPQIEVHLPGGPLTVEIDDARSFITGEAVKVFEGSL